MQNSRLRWQCRRGMRELDELLLAYLDHEYEQADDGQKQAFCSLLGLSDPELTGYLLQRETPAQEFTLVIQHILNRTQS